MALFVINRFLDDSYEEEVSEDRSQALLEKLHEQARARQLAKEQVSVASKKPAAGQEHHPVGNSTSPSNTEGRKGTKSDKNILSTGKKKKRDTREDEEPLQGTECNLPSTSQIEKASALKEKEKRKRKKIESEIGGKNEPGRAEEAKRKRKTEYGEDDELGRKKKGKRKRKEGRSKSREEDEAGKEEGGKMKGQSSNLELDEADEAGREEDQKSKRRNKKSELGEEDGAKGQAAGKRKKRNRASKPEEEYELGREEEEEIVGVNENEIGDLTAEEAEGTAKTDPETSSLVLGGFEKKAVQKVQRVLPQWLSHPSLVHKGIRKHLVPIQDVPGIHPTLLKKLQACKIQSFFPVQAEVIPALLESAQHGFLVGRGGYRPSDICVSAPTGSGKTLAFVIPIIQALLERVVCRVRALVVLPTKELAQQVCKVFSIYTNGTSLKVVLAAGQKSFAKEQESLVEKIVMGYRSLADIVVATPGRLVDHIDQTQGFSLKELRFLVIDEADRMIDSLSQDWLNRVTKAVYRNEEGDNPSSLFARREPGPITAASTCFPQMPLQKLLFSATLTQNPEKLQKLGLYLPRLFTSVYDNSPGSAETGDVTESSYTLPEGLTHYYVPCNLNSKPLFLLHFLVTLKFTPMLCFTNSREASHRLFLLIQAFRGVRAAEFSSLLNPGERRKTLKEFEQGKIHILISTDATARGIDINGVKCVFNYDAPQFIRVYIHRVGRTARAGKSGLAFTMLLSVQEKRFLRMLTDAGASGIQRQLVMKENLEPLLERYEKALSELQRTVMEEHVKKRV